MAYLMIENEGVAPIEGFTLLGMSTARNSEVEGVIGKFGSGTKHAINLLLRKGIEFHIYCGKTRLEFFYDIETIDDGLDTVETAVVKCKLSGEQNRTIDCGWCLDFGAMDWDDPKMAVREFVSNAIDRSKRGDSAMKMKTETNRRAKSGTTRIFISMNHEAINEFYLNRGFYFLHFSGNPEQAEQSLLQKNPEHTGPVIYREGVFVRVLNSKNPSAFDYNFKDGEITIDECRNSSEYELRASIARRLNAAEPEILVELFKAMENDETYEADLDEFYLGYYLSFSDNWKTAWESFAGNAVVANDINGYDHCKEHAKGKGYAVKSIKSNSFAKVIHKMGVPDVVSVIGKHASEGRAELEPTEEIIKAVDQVWQWCEVCELTNGKEKPQIKAFKQLMDSHETLMGYHEKGTVYLEESLGGKALLQTAIEEVAHYITGATDMSRDFQDFAFRLVVEVCA